MWLKCFSFIIKFRLNPFNNGEIYVIQKNSHGSFSGPDVFQPSGLLEFIKIG